MEGGDFSTPTKKFEDSEFMIVKTVQLLIIGHSVLFQVCRT